jgi:hypothetical protein
MHRTEWFGEIARQLVVPSVHLVAVEQGACPPSGARAPATLEDRRYLTRLKSMRDFRPCADCRWNALRGCGTVALVSTVWGSRAVKEVRLYVLGDVHNDRDERVQAWRLEDELHRLDVEDIWRPAGWDQKAPR